MYQNSHYNRQKKTEWEKRTLKGAETKETGYPGCVLFYTGLVCT